MTDILDLPVEIIVEILKTSELSHPADLQNFISSHSAVRRIFLRNPRIILLELCRNLVPGCLWDAVAVLRCPYMYPGETRQSLAQRMSTYRSNSLYGPLHAPETMTDYREFWLLIAKVDLCIFDWSTKVMRGTTSRPESFESPPVWPKYWYWRRDSRGMPRPTVSNTELLRFRRGFLNYELYCRACYQRPLQPINTTPAEFFPWLPPWQMEEIRDVSRYVIMTHLGFLKRIHIVFDNAYLSCNDTLVPFKQLAPGSRRPLVHESLRYLSDRRNMPTMYGPISTVKNMTVGMASLGLDFLIDCGSREEGEMVELVTSHARLFSQFLSKFFYDVYHTPRMWENKTYQQMTSEASCRDPAASGREAWFIYNESVRRDIEDGASPNDAQYRVHVDSDLTSRAWVFWDDPQTILTGTNLSPGWDMDNLEFMNSTFEAWPKASGGCSVSRDNWEMLLDKYGSKTASKFVLQLGARRWDFGNTAI